MRPACHRRCVVSCKVGRDNRYLAGAVAGGHCRPTRVRTRVCVRPALIDCPGDFEPACALALGRARRRIRRKGFDPRVQQPTATSARADPCAVPEPIDVRIVSKIVLCASVAASPALGGESFTGRDAAYIDWGVKNCGGVSTDKEHAMAEKANTKNGAVFIEQYQDESNKLTAASSGPRNQENICADIKEWYGSFGSRIADLLRWSQEKTDATKKESSKDSNSSGRKRRSAN